MIVTCIRNVNKRIVAVMRELGTVNVLKGLLLAIVLPVCALAFLLGWIFGTVALLHALGLTPENDALVGGTIITISLTLMIVVYVYITTIICEYISTHESK